MVLPVEGTLRDSAFLAGRVVVALYVLLVRVWVAAKDTRHLAVFGVECSRAVGAAHPSFQR